MRRFQLRRDTPGAGAEILAEGVVFQDGGPVAARLVAGAGGPPVLWGSLETMQSVWCYGDLAQIEWIDQAPDAADANNGQLLIVSVLEVQKHLKLHLSRKISTTYWNVIYSRGRQPYSFFWPESWGPPPVRGDQIELELDANFQATYAHILGEPVPDQALAADPLELEGEQ